MFLLTLHFALPVVAVKQLSHTIVLFIYLLFFSLQNTICGGTQVKVFDCSTYYLYGFESCGSGDFLAKVSAACESHGIVS